MKIGNPILLLRDKLGCSVVAIDARGIPKTLAWISKGEMTYVLSAFKTIRKAQRARVQPSKPSIMPRKAIPTDTVFESFREELLK